MGNLSKVSKLSVHNLLMDKDMKGKFIYCANIYGSILYTIIKYFKPLNVMVLSKI